MSHHNKHCRLFELGLVTSAGRLNPPCVQNGSVDPLLHQHKDLLGHSVLTQVDRDPVLICVGRVKLWFSPAAHLQTTGSYYKNDIICRCVCVFSSVGRCSGVGSGVEICLMELPHPQHCQHVTLFCALFISHLWLFQDESLSCLLCLFGGFFPFNLHGHVVMFWNSAGIACLFLETQNHVN